MYSRCGPPSELHYRISFTNAPPPLPCPVAPDPPTLRDRLGLLPGEDSMSLTLDWDPPSMPPGYQCCDEYFLIFTTSGLPSTYTYVQVTGATSITIQPLNSSWEYYVGVSSPVSNILLVLLSPPFPKLQPLAPCAFTDSCGKLSHLTVSGPSACMLHVFCICNAGHYPPLPAGDVSTSPIVTSTAFSFPPITPTPSQPPVHTPSGSLPVYTVVTSSFSPSVTPSSPLTGSSLSLSPSLPLPHPLMLSSSPFRPNSLTCHHYISTFSGSTALAGYCSNFGVRLLHSTSASLHCSLPYWQ